MTGQYLHWMDGGFPIVCSGGEAPDGAIWLTPEQAQEISAAMSRGDKINRDGDGWVITTPVPTLEQLTTQAQAFRQAAYTAEADPLFFKWQAGEGTEADWLAKREEIRARYPYPGEETP